MSKFQTVVLEVVVKPSKMLYCSSSKLKACAVLLVIMIYVYLIIFFKTVYLKTKRLDQIVEMAVETEKQMLKVYKMDQELAMKIEQLDNVYDSQ